MMMIQFFTFPHTSILLSRTGSAEEKGVGKGLGFTYNVPLPAGTGDETYEDIYSMMLPDLVYHFRPDMVLVSAGYDLHIDDPLTHLEVTTEGIGKIVENILKTSDSPFIFMLEGGYNLQALGKSALITVKKMLTV